MRAHPHYNPFNVREPAEYPDWTKVFARPEQPLDLEIGFSTGRWLIQYAKNFPERNIAGLEIRAKFIEYARRRIAAENLANAYVLQANAATALRRLFAPRSLSRVIVMFPDPWYKPRHLKRRVVNPQFLTELAECLRGGAELHIATDQQNLAAAMLADLTAAPEYQNKHAPYAPENFAGLTTDIELYNTRRGREIYRLVFVRR
ncbi:tRNA (guanosine(46)-N7)-methyltransferase TrmB [Candidatus Termititenax aidoneus]|uniref:tRNA (guanine-N(7)-)-methyltransferase n=1 Tax=Termititenax aidoneus TaxID=2218524 RepID=A0A388TAV3_TERA1|nr:tRNA (guanosine(46)-N7)-methyltransferase TrmB [Candidatus Termititenax aidoneus]